MSFVPRSSGWLCRGKCKNVERWDGVVGNNCNCVIFGGFGKYTSEQHSPSTAAGGGELLVGLGLRDCVACVCLIGTFPQMHSYFQLTCNALDNECTKVVIYRAHDFGLV